jgi:hypothetical protein
MDFDPRCNHEPMVGEEWWEIETLSPAGTGGGTYEGMKRQIPASARRYVDATGQTEPALEAYGRGWGITTTYIGLSPTKLSRLLFPKTESTQTPIGYTMRRESNTRVT